MPKTEIDYSNTIIYKITCKDKTITDVYVGHTTNFVQRKHGHKQSCMNNKSSNHNCKLYEVIRANGGWINWKMEIINFFECADHYEARKREQEYFIALNATLNSIEPFPKPKVIKKIYTDKSEFYCNSCGIHCINSISFDKHNKTTKHQKKLTINESVPTIPGRFICELCNTSTNSKKDYNKHCLTSKHLNRTAIEQKIPTYPFSCKICNKGYNARNSLWYHEQKCVKTESPPIENQEDDIKQIKNIILDLVKSNTELQKQMLEVCKNSFNS